VTLVAGVDSSTKSTKVVIVESDDGKIVASASARHPATRATAKRTGPHDVVAGALQGVGSLRAVTRSVKAISIAAQQHGLVALDGNGEAVHPAKLWNDSESAPQAEWLTQRSEPTSGRSDAAACSARHSPSRNWRGCERRGPTPLVRFDACSCPTNG